MNFLLTCHFLFAVNKRHLFYDIPLCESPSVTEDRTTTPYSNMSAPDQFQEIVDSLRRILNTTTPPVTSVTTASTASPTVVASPMAKPGPFSGVVEE